MKSVIISIFVLIIVATFMSCSSDIKKDELSMIDLKLLKVKTNRESIVGFIFVYCNNDSLYKFIIDHQYYSKGIDFYGQLNEFCISRKLIEPHKKNRELFYISFELCDKNPNQYNKDHLDSLSKKIFKDIKIHLEFPNGKQIIIRNFCNTHSKFLEVKKFNPNEWFNANMIDTLNSPPPPTFKILY